VVARDRQAAARPARSGGDQASSGHGANRRVGLGGALARVAEDATAFGQRDAAHNVVVNAVWTEDDPDARGHIAWARDSFDAMQPHARDRVYVNFLGEEGPDRVRQAYGTEKYDRLVALKREYDPTNFFRLNQNIPPT
jgi:FAD/FMN-containing dehydrogenase